MSPEVLDALIPPVIDADALEVSSLKAQYRGLVDEWSRVRDECHKKERELLEPIEKKMVATRKQIERLGPKPSCFGTESHSFLPSCEECNVGMLCYQMLRLMERDP